MLQRIRKGKIMKHLNVEQSEAVKVMVAYDVNMFYVYLMIESGSTIVFKTSHDWLGVVTSSEFQKYMLDWNLPIEYSTMALEMKQQQAGQ